MCVSAFLGSQLRPKAPIRRPRGLPACPGRNASGQPAVTTPSCGPTPGGLDLAAQIGAPSRDREGAGLVGHAGLGGPALQGVAGVGGLLAVHQAQTGGGAAGGGLDAGDYLYFHDTSGNVGQLVAWATGYGEAQADEWHVDRLVARYEYDPYGRIVGPDTNSDGEFDEQEDPGPYAAANPFRWSTKRFDPETGVSDFGMRYYSATLGRWINRDPIGDLGGANVYAYVGNNPTNRTDYLGMMLAECRPGEPCHDEGSSSGPPPQEENDRKPCPKKPDLYQHAQPDKANPLGPDEDCLKSLAAAMSDPVNQQLLASLPAGCRPNPRCGGKSEPPCDMPGPIGGYNSSTGQIVMCTGFNASQLTHELIHAKQNCGKPGRPGGPAGPPAPMTAPEVACQEVQATACSGEYGKPNWRDAEGFVTPVGQRCVNSLVGACTQDPSICGGRTGGALVSYAEGQCQGAINNPACRSCGGIPQR